MADWRQARRAGGEAGRSARRTVTVYKGDTLWSLAFAYGVSVDELLRANAGLSERSMRAGMKLRLPSDADDGREAPWMRWDGREAAAAGAAQQQQSELQRRGPPLGRLFLALAAGVAIGALRQSPGPAGEAVRGSFDTAGRAADAVAKAVGPAASSAAQRAQPLWAKSVGALGGALQFVARSSAHGVIRLLGGTPGRDSAAVAAEAAASASADAAATRAENARVRADLAQSQALSAAAEAARLSLARELAAALAAVEALTQTESAQRAVAEAQSQRARELAQQLNAVRRAAEPAPSDAPRLAWPAESHAALCASAAAH
jgi:LysM repeat protein